MSDRLSFHVQWCATCEQMAPYFTRLGSCGGCEQYARARHYVLRPTESNRQLAMWASDRMAMIMDGYRLRNGVHNVMPKAVVVVPEDLVQRPSQVSVHPAEDDEDDDDVFQ